MLSQTLVDAIGQALQAGKKVYLYLNQRGAQHCLICRDCGHIWRCPDCDHVLRVHREPEELLVCHLCSRSRDIPATCDRCQSSHLASLGSRIQSVTRDVQVLFPKARVVRVESTQKSEDLSLIHI